eukprot:GILI01021850.1.p1 GENE.GILI01021850.1~~GILI01021850.1.p1  ORF type:complete len:456 (+),score=53.93 GILI01021850.1:99-1466(+)
MDGLTPWEIASLKVAYHRIDEDHKGYLDRQNFNTICDDCNLNLSKRQEDVLFMRIDHDDDGRIQFQDLLNYLSAVTFEGKASSSVAAASTPELASTPSIQLSRATKALATVSHALTSSTALSDPTDADVALFTRSAARIRQSYASDISAIFAGGILGLLPLLKTKFFVVAGTLFYDPIRLFRDNIVDYTGSLENNNKAAQRTINSYQFIRNPKVAWTTKVRMSLMLCSGLLGVLGWVVFAATLDCLGGVVMFLTYSRARHRIANNDDAAAMFAGRRYLMEACAGFIGGAAGGFVERPLRYVAHHRILSPVKLLEPVTVSNAFKGCTWAVYRQAVCHAVFFSAFSYSHDMHRWLWYRYMDAERTSWRDACITAASGCMAGGSYRLISLPMLNIYHETGGASRPWSFQPRTAQFLKKHTTAKSAFKAAYSGLGYSMAWIMPITGAAFLVYERLIVNL